MKVEVFKNIKDIKEDYIRLYNRANASPYISYGWLYYTKKGYRDMKPFANISISKRFYILYNDKNEIKCIAPILIERLSSGKRIMINGINTPAEPLDFLYTNDITNEEFDFLFQQINKDYRNCEFDLRPLLSESKLAQYCKDYLKIKKMNESISYDLNFKTYDEWYANLSKSVRQNIRTSYNRLKKDGKEYEFNILLNERLSKKEYTDVNNLLAERLAKHMSINNKFIIQILQYLKRINISSKALNLASNGYCAILYIDGEIAGYTTGLYNKGIMSVCRFAIDTKFSRYSPGAIIHNELFKFLDGNKELAINRYIFSRGDEKYKSSFGGKLLEYERFKYVSTKNIK